MSFEKRKFCITGKLNERTRDEYKRFIEDHDGIFSSSVTKTTDYLVTNDEVHTNLNNDDYLSNTTKTNKALALGIPIITEDDFLNIIYKNEKLNAIAKEMGW